MQTTQTKSPASLLVTFDDDAPFADTVDSFCEANPDLAESVRLLSPGDFAIFGGGAQPIVRVEAVRK